MVINVMKQHLNLKTNQHSGHIMAPRYASTWILGIKTTEKHWNWAKYCDYLHGTDTEFSSLLQVYKSPPLWNTKAHHRLHNSPSPVPTLSRLIPLHNLIPYSFRIQSTNGTVPVKLLTVTCRGRNKYATPNTFDPVKFINGWRKRKFIDKKLEWNKILQKEQWV
jgi:hypothetical protein